MQQAFNGRQIWTGAVFVKVLAAGQDTDSTGARRVDLPRTADELMNQVSDPLDMAACPQLSTDDGHIPVHVSTPLTASPVVLAPYQPGAETDGASEHLTARARRENIVKNLKNLKFRYNPISSNNNRQMSRFPPASALPATNENHKVRSSVYDRDPPCLQCRVPGSPDIKHYHKSNEYDRELAIKDGIDSYHCFVCGMVHPVKTPNRRKVLFTSSTLINFWKVEGFFPCVHFEVEAVVGARVRDLTMVFNKQYSGKQEPMDVVICCGINNVGENQAESAIVEEFKDFQNTIFEHSRTHKHIEKGFEKNHC